MNKTSVSPAILKRMKRCDNLETLSSSSLAQYVAIIWAERGNELLQAKDYESAALFYRRALALLQMHTKHKTKP